MAVSLRAPCDAVEAFLLTFFFLKKRLPLFLVLFPMNFSSSESAAEATLPPSPPWLPWLFRSPAAATGRPVALLHDSRRRNGDSNSGVNSSHESRGPSEEGRRRCRAVTVKTIATEQVQGKKAFVSSIRLDSVSSMLI